MANQNNSKILLSVLLLISTLAGSFFIFQYQEFDKEMKEMFLAKAPAVIFSKERKESITLYFVGDIMLDRGVEYMIETQGNGDYRFPFLKISQYFKKADLIFGNLEGPISNRGERMGSIYSFRFSPQSLEGLIYAGFDILSVANNHIFDFGRLAMEDTFFNLRESKIEYLGGGFNEREAYSPIIKEIKDTKIVFLAYTNLGSKYWGAIGENPGIAWLEKERMKEEISNAKNLADIVVVSLHYGSEYRTEPTPFQISISQEAVQSGADLVIGHHSHVIGPIERYKQGYIAYSLGNFIFDQDFSEETMKGLLLRVIIQEKEIEKVVPVEVRINSFFQPEIESN